MTTRGASMTFIRNLFRFDNLKKKILFSFSIVIYLVVLLGGFTIYSMFKVNEELELVLDEEMEILITSEQLVINLLDRTRLIQGIFLFGDIEYKRSYDAGVEDSLTLEEHALEIIDSPEFLASLEKMTEWGGVAEELLSTYYNGNIPDARSMLDETLEPLGIELIQEFQLHEENAENRIATISDQIQQNLYTLMIAGVVISISVIILGVIISLITARKITKPIGTLMKRMKSIASGHLSHAPLTVNTRDEIGQLVFAANDMNQSMRDIMLKIKDVTDTLSAHSEELTESTHEVQQGSKQISLTMEDLASGSDKQANQANELTRIVTNFTEKMDDVNRNTIHIQEESNQVLELTNEGSVSMDSSTKQMENIDRIVQAVVNKVEELNEKTQNISQLVTVIKDIANQTNLLSLNASIEAARAGEHGRGFAIVAEEVGKLAEQVDHSVTDISEIVTTIQIDFHEVTNELNRGYEEVKEGSVQIQQTGEKFTRIHDSVTDMFRNMQHISDYLAEFADSSKKINGSIQEIAAISEESAAGVEQTLASTQQSTSAMDEITGNAADLARLAEELNELVHRFKV